MAAGHIELKKRNEAFAKRAGKTNKLKTVDPLDKKPKIAKWTIGILLFVVCAPLFLELLQQLYNAFFAKTDFPKKR